MSSSTEDFQKFLDTQQYTRKGILLYEQIFGRTYVSTGGASTTARFCRELSPLLSGAPDRKVLDIGCGIGGSAFHLASHYGAQVYGVDLSNNMVALARERREEQSPAVQHRVRFHVADATAMDYPADFYDVVYSRDTFLHIADKPALFRRLHGTLRPGGSLFITDYCRGDREHDEDFKAYVKQRGYNLLTVPEYGRALEEAGFGEVEAVDSSDYFVDILKGELAEFEPTKERVVEEYSLGDYEYICHGWKNKIGRVSRGDQAWGVFTAKKLFP